jgi:putative transposase
MPAKNAVKQFEPNTMYHVYNRGVDKRVIFQDDQDYAVFLSFLKYALLTSTEDKAQNRIDSSLLSDAQRFNLRRLGLAGQLDLVSFCLMPNHFHLLLFQHSQDAITKLMRSIATGYSMYFNKRYDRSGTLFQGRYKASAVKTDSYWDHISRYIHLNPMDIGENWRTYPRSSYRVYAGKAQNDWLHPGYVLDTFSSRAQYDQYVAEYETKHTELKQLAKELGI